jgi:adenylate kinase
MCCAPYPSALMFGLPGAGKGTQGDFLRNLPEFCIFSSGHLFRDLDPASADGATVSAFTSRGELVPDELTIRMFFSWIENAKAAGDFRPESQLLILDGLPRSVRQVELIRPQIDVKGVIHLVCHDEEQMIERIRRRARIEGREDDVGDAVIRRRFEVYHEQTKPVLQQYPAELIREVESTGTPSEVLLQCLQVLVPLLTSAFPETTGDG